MERIEFKWVDDILCEVNYLFNDSMSHELYQHYETRIKNQITLSIDRYQIFLSEEATTHKEINRKLTKLHVQITQFQNRIYKTAPEFFDQSQLSLKRPCVGVILHHQLDKVLEYFREQYSELYPDELKLCRVKVSWFKHHLQLFLEEISDDWKKKAHQNDLRVLILSLIIETIGKKRLSTGEYEYSEYYMQQLKNLMKKDWSNELGIDFLVRLNANSPKVFQHLVRIVKMHMKSYSNLDKRIEYLFTELRELNAINDCCGYAYHPDKLPLKEQLSKWIIDQIKVVREEIDFKKDMQFLTKHEPQENGSKLTTNLSVGEIALLYRLMYEQKIFGGGQVSELVKWQTLSLQSKSQKEISAKSLRNKFYDPDSSSRRKVAALLEAMIKYLDVLD